MESRINKWHSRQRRGLSFVEFVGCLVAMIGGVLLGSVYLGIDMQRMAVAVLEQAQVVAPGYFNPITATSATEPPGTAAAEGQQSVTTAADAVTSTESAPAVEPAKDVVAGKAITTPKPTAAEQSKATRAYWDQLTAIMLSEAQSRVRGEGNPDEWELYDYLAQRKRGHDDSLAQFEKLEQFGVDERLLEHGEQVVEWHKSAIKLFDHALSLLSDGPGAKLTGPFAQSWQSKATQLRMEENLVIDRHRAIANYLDREYVGEAPFVPAFQQQ